MTEFEAVAEWAAARPVLEAMVNVPPAGQRKLGDDGTEFVTEDWALLGTLLDSGGPHTWSANQVARLEDLLAVMREELQSELSAQDLECLRQLERWAILRCRVMNAGLTSSARTPFTEPALV